MFFPKAHVGVLALFAMSCDAKPLVKSKGSSTQKLKKLSSDKIIPNKFIIQFNPLATVNNKLKNIAQSFKDAKTKVPKLTKRSSVVGVAQKNARFRKAVKKVMSARAFVDLLSQEAKNKRLPMKVVKIYDSDILQGAQVALTEKEMLKLCKSDLIQRVWHLVSSFLSLYEMRLLLNMIHLEEKTVPSREDCENSTKTGKQYNNTAKKTDTEIDETCTRSDWTRSCKGCV
jgi:hypothetical protein